MGQDYRIEIVNLINVEFMEFTLDFFKKVVNAKLMQEDITVDWYKRAFINEALPSDDIAINAGLNKKTISNMYRTATKEVVLDASRTHFDILYNSIKSLVNDRENIDLILTIKLKDINVSVDLGISEALIVINTLAVKRAALRGGAWSSAGKQVEKILMLTLCKLYNVSEDNYISSRCRHFIRAK